MLRIASHRALLVGSFVLIAASATAEVYPSRPITLVNPFAAGSATDTAARLVAEGLAAQLGQPVVVENRTGASGVIGAAYVAKAKPDGYTLLIGGTSTHAGNPSLFRTIPYDPVKDFVPIAYLNELQYVLVVPGASNAQTLQDLVARGKASPPGTLSYATPTPTSTIGAELLKSATGLEITQVSYKGAQPAIPDLVTGRVSMMFMDFGTAQPLLQDARVRAVALAGQRRSEHIPTVPTLKELGFDINLTTWTAIWAPVGTPEAISEKLNTALRAVMSSSPLTARLRQNGFTVGEPKSREQLATHVEAELHRWSAMVKQAGILPQ